VNESKRGDFSMNRLKMSVAMLGLLIPCFAPSLRADGRNKETCVTINQPLQIQDTVLAPGQYLFKLLEPDTDQTVISIFNANGTQLQGIIIGRTAYRYDAGDKKLVTVSQPVGGRPAILNFWFFPGTSEGIEFPLTNPGSGSARVAKSKGKGQNTGAAGG
jgi:hypothetical protein